MNDYYSNIGSCSAFAGGTLLASGTPRVVALAVKHAADAGEPELVLVFNDATGHPVEFDLRGTPEEVGARIPAPSSQAPTPASSAADAACPADAAGPATGVRGPGRPRLGVVGREVTLLPRHWDWLAAQPGGASVTLRRLVENARRAGAASESARLARDTTYRVMLALAGNEPGFEEASRALFAGDRARFSALVAPWPPDVSDYVGRLAAPSFASSEQE